MAPGSGCRGYLGGFPRSGGLPGKLITEAEPETQQGRRIKSFGRSANNVRWWWLQFRFHHHSTTLTTSHRYRLTHGCRPWPNNPPTPFHHHHAMGCCQAKRYSNFLHKLYEAHQQHSNRTAVGIGFGFAGWGVRGWRSQVGAKGGRRWRRTSRIAAQALANSQAAAERQTWS